MPVDTERSLSLIRKLDQLLAKTHAKPLAAHRAKKRRALETALLPERVHQIRTTARRLEALLQTLYPRQNKQHTKLRKRLRRLRRGAGGVRDVDVQIVALRKLHIGRENERKARLMQALNDLRELREDKLLQALVDKDVRKIRKALQRWALELQPQDGGPAEAAGSEAAAPVRLDPWEALDPLSMALRRFGRLSRQVRALTPENLHGYRTDCKRIRYVAEMATDGEPAHHVVDLLKRIQDVAGDWHDWVTLTATAEAQVAHSLDSALIAAMHNITNAKFVEARGVVLEARKELMAEYRAMLARERACKKLAAPAARAPGHARRTLKTGLGRIRPKKVIAASASSSAA